jgi:hypothetical protein
MENIAKLRAQLLCKENEYWVKYGDKCEHPIHINEEWKKEAIEAVESHESNKPSN